MKVTVSRIAELAKVSRGTVDRIIHNRPGVNDEVRVRVLSIIEAMDYTPNLAGKALVSQNKKIGIGIVLSPDFHPFMAELRDGIRVAAEEIKAFGFTTDIEVVRTLDAGRIAFVGQDNEKAGWTAYGLLENLLSPGSRIGIIASSMGLDCHRSRLSGFRSRMEDSGSTLSLVGVEENLDRNDKAFDIVSAYVEQFPNLSGIYLTGGGAGGVGKALKVHGLEDTVKVVTHDLVPEVIELMKDGIVKFVICQKPRSQGAEPVRIIFDYI